MRAPAALLALIALAACSTSPSQKPAKPAHTKTADRRHASKVDADWPTYPHTQPNGAPLNADYCAKVADAPGTKFDNMKTCVMIACDTGDRESCRLAESYNGNLFDTDQKGLDTEISDAAQAVLSSAFRKCFGPDAPLNAESYDCLDTEYHRLDALLTSEYKAALARQPDDAARARLTAAERNWWRTRFAHCKDDVGDMQGSTATVINESCEIDTLAERIVALRQA